MTSKHRTKKHRQIMKLVRTMTEREQREVLGIVDAMRAEKMGLTP